MRCSQCKRENVFKRAVCFYCGGRLIFEEKQEVDLRCPGCSGIMKKVVRAGITTDECQDCKGNWYDKTELEQLLQKSEKDLQAQPEDATPQEASEPNQPGIDSHYGERPFPPQRAVHRSHPNSQRRYPSSTPLNPAYRRCPHCQDMMNKSNYLKSGIFVDSCMKHGIYLDAGEFEDLHYFIIHNPLQF